MHKVFKFPGADIQSTGNRLLWMQHPENMGGLPCNDVAFVAMVQRALNALACHKPASGKSNMTALKWPATPPMCGGQQFGEGEREGQGAWVNSLERGREGQGS